MAAGKACMDAKTIWLLGECEAGVCRQGLIVGNELHVSQSGE